MNIIIFHILSLTLFITWTQKFLLLNKFYKFLVQDLSKNLDD